LVAWLVVGIQAALVGPAGGGVDLSAGEQQPGLPHRHGVEQGDHPWAQLDAFGLADRLQGAGRVALRLPNPGLRGKAAGQPKGVGELPAQLDTPIGVVEGGLQLISFT
jgi:hypothetical protein